jgi:predicted RNA binding protein YcfA (HicA-like mRNA interferase family)
MQALDLIGAIGPMQRGGALVVTKVREVLARLRRDGWILARVKGSHHIFHHPNKRETVTLAYHQEGDEVPVGTLRSIKKQAGWL